VTYAYVKKYIFFKISVFNKVWYNVIRWEIKSVKVLKIQKRAQDGGKFVSLMHRPPLPPGNTPGTHFC